MMYLYAVRHTKIQNPLNLCYGQKDMDLSDTFEYESQIILKNLQSLMRESDPKNQSLVKMFTSPSLRCQKLASFLSEHLDIELQTDSRILEYHFGAWEGIPWDSIPQAELENWMRDFVNGSPSGGESMSEFQKRVEDFLNYLREDQKFFSSEVQNVIQKQPCSTKVILVTHSGVIRMIHATILGYPLVNFFKFEVKYGKVYEFFLSRETKMDRVF